MIIATLRGTALLLMAAVAMASNPQDDAPSGEWVESDAPTATSFVSGTTFRKTPVTYAVQNGVAVFEGDILLGSVDDLERARFAAELQTLITERKPPNLDVPDDVASALATLTTFETDGVVYPDLSARWPDKTVPYEIDETLDSPERVTGAIAHWRSKTSMRFVERTDERNYIRFTPHASACNSFVGMQRGMQPINLAPDCTQGNVIHEIGHAIGLWHEQSREDRDDHIEIVWDNILEKHRHNFNQHVTDGDDVGGYDFDSIMHYPSWAFAMDDSKPSIVSRVPGKRFGQRRSLSDGDRAAVKFLYP